jgi:hypothetical protein
MNCGSVHLWKPDPGHPLGGTIQTATVPLLRLEGNGTRLCGRFVRVRNAAVIQAPVGPHGQSQATALGDAQPNQPGQFLFTPQRGGPRVDENELVPAPLRQEYIEAARFGEVNAYYHLDRSAAYLDELLRELGEPPLPPVTAVVNAHPATSEREGRRDGVWRAGTWCPFQGGHYRLPSWRYDVAEWEPICPTGEIHLGPGWREMAWGALAEVGGGPYRHNASHNAGTLYHEYGHHITRHTADFRANARREPQRQSNRKIATDEGTCDYWAATMLGTPHIWSWHHRHDALVVHRRSLVSPKTMTAFDAGQGADPHLNGTIWAAGLWDFRSRLVARHPEGARQADRLILKSLLLLGERGGAAPDIEGVCRAREGFAVALSALLEADQWLNDGQHREAIESSFATRGIYPETRTGN